MVVEKAELFFDMRSANVEAAVPGTFAERELIQFVWVVSVLLVSEFVMRELVVRYLVVRKVVAR